MALGYFTDSTPLTPLRDPFNVLVDEINDNAAIVTDQHQNYDFRWADAAARTAQAGMRAGDTGYQVDTATDYIYTGSAWRVNTGGLILLSKQAFSTASSVTFDGVFTSGFRDYLIKFSTNSTSTNLGLSLNLRAASSTISSANYDTNNIVGVGGTASNSQGLAATSWSPAAGTTAHHTFDLRLFSPALSAPTTGFIDVVSSTNPMTAASTTGTAIRGLLFRLTTQVDGFIITTSTGNMTGSVSVYGYA